MKPRMLVTGATGLLGANLVWHAAERGYEVFSSGRHAPNFPDRAQSISMDITNRDQVLSQLAGVRPELIMHCAAETRVDHCEEYPEHARAVNAWGTRNIAEGAQTVGAYLVYLSSDSAFDGHRGGYREQDPPNPINVYSRTKVEGEQWTQQLCVRHLVVRTNMFGWNLKPKESLGEWILNNLRRSQPISGFRDVVFNPLLVNDLSDILCDMAEKGLQGLYHVGSQGCLSKFDFALLVARHFSLEAALIHPSLLSESTLKAPRPLITNLNTTAVSRDLGRPMPTIDEEVQRFASLAQSGFADSLKKAFTASPHI